MMVDMAPLDGVQLAILNKRLEGVCRKMANTLFRTGRSGVLNTARDFSCCIVTADNQLLAAAESLPIHVLSGPDLMAAAMQEFHPVLKRGDAFLHNSPYHGCSHPADHTILVPVVDDDGRHRFTMVAKAHQADCGNSLPTTYMGGARDVYQEGALIFPAVRVQENFEDIEDIVRMCRMRIRVPEQWWGDYLAEMGAARIGERELMALAAEVGWDTLDAFTNQWFEYSEQRMASEIKQLPAGAMTVTSSHDPFPGAPDGIDVKVKLTIDPADGVIEVDLRDNQDCLPCGLNLSEACARTSAMVGVFNSVDHSVPPNAGSFRRIRVLLRENCVVGIPLHPTSCSVATTNVADHVANGVQRAIAELADGAGMAEVGSVIPPSVGVISGLKPDTGEAFVNQVFLGFGGGAAAPTADAWVTIGHVGNAGLCYQDSAEVDEQVFPIFVKGRQFIPDTGGTGRYRGGGGMQVEFGPDGCDLEVGYVSDGTLYPAQGACGGGPGGRAQQSVRHANGEMETLEACAQVPVREGETIVCLSCGGGGFGSPLERPRRGRQRRARKVDQCGSRAKPIWRRSRRKR